MTVSLDFNGQTFFGETIAEVTKKARAFKRNQAKAQKQADADYSKAYDNARLNLAFLVNYIGRVMEFNSTAANEWVIDDINPDERGLYPFYTGFGGADIKFIYDTPLKTIESMTGTVAVLIKHQSGEPKWKTIGVHNGAYTFFDIPPFLEDLINKHIHSVKGEN